MANSDYVASVDDTILTDNDINFRAVKTAVLTKLLPRWKFVANVLGIQSAIGEANTPNQKESCMDDDIRTWLRRAHNEKDYGPPSWRKLVQAIADKIGGDDPAYAMEIVRAHPKGAAHTTRHGTHGATGHGTRPNVADNGTAVAADTGEQPTMPQLLTFKIPEKVGTHYKNFGIFLLDDKTGARVSNIEHACLQNPANINSKILEEWLAGKGKPVTWPTLIKTLRDCDLNTLATDIEKKKKL